MTKADRISVVFWFGIGPVVGIAICIADWVGIIPAWVYTAFNWFFERLFYLVQFTIAAAILLLVFSCPFLLLLYFIALNKRP